MLNFITILRDEFGFRWESLMVQAGLLIFSAILIILVPEILVALIAGFLLFLGLSLFTIAWKLRKMERNYHHIRIDYF